LKLLVERGANVEIQLEDGSTALMVAASKGHHKCVDILINSSTQIDKQHNVGWTALLMAAWQGRETCLKNVGNGRDDPLYAQIACFRSGAEQLTRRLSMARRRAGCVRLSLHRTRTAGFGWPPECDE
jgi:hypothetical protein